jgi:cholesterol transport system auxiliary component
MKTHYLYFVMMAVVVLLAGCQSTMNKNQYALDISPPQAVNVSSSSNAIIEVRPFTIDSKFSGRQMVYRIDEFRYAPDYYNEFLVPPAVMITEATRNWLADTGTFGHVAEPGSGIMPTCTFSGSIIECYADIRDKAAPAAVLELRMFLTKQDKGIETLVWSHTYQMREPMKNIQAPFFAATMSRCVQNVLQKLQIDLAQQPK